MLRASLIDVVLPRATGATYEHCNKTKHKIEN